MIENLKNITLYYPKKKLSNDELCIGMEKLTPDRIFRKTGIRNRFISGEDELGSDMALEVAEMFFKKNNIKKSEIDFLIVCSECFDFIAPMTSSILQDKIGLNQNIGTLDLPMGCSGYVYGLALSKSLLLSGMAKNVLFITADTSTKTIKESDIELRSIFSDVAAATLITKKDVSSIGETVFGSDGSGWQNLYIKNSCFRNDGKVEPEMVMNGIEIFNFGLRVVPKLIDDVLNKNSLTKNEIDFFVFHQPTQFLLKTLQKKLSIPDNKFIINLEKNGNTVSSTIPIAIKEAVDEGKIKKGQNILLAGFGIGYSWAATILKI